MAQQPPNAWCAKLGVDAPDLEALAARKDVNLRYLLIAALLERGALMTLDELATRISALAGRGTKDRLLVSLVKAWKGTPPLYRDDEGRFGLDPHAEEFRWVLLRLFPRPPRVEPEAPPPGPPPTEPLTEDELRAGLQDANVYSLSRPRLYAAVLDAVGRPLTYEELEAFLAPLLLKRSPPSGASAMRMRGPLVAADESGRLLLLDAPDQLLKMRAQIRSILERTRQDAARKHAMEDGGRRWKTRQRRVEAEAQTRRRAVLHGLTVGGGVTALTILDVTTRSIETRVGEEVGDVARLLEGYDVLVGLDLRVLLDRLGVDPGAARRVDLRSAPKSKRLNRQGRTLKLTPEMLIRYSVNLSRALGDGKKMAAYARAGQRSKLVRRMESDAKALYAWYTYGVLHRGVRLNWGFLDEMLSVSWAEDGDASLHGILEATNAGRTVEVVLHTAPGWKDPWARAREVLSYETLDWSVMVRDKNEVRYVPLADVVAARVR